MKIKQGQVSGLASSLSTVAQDAAQLVSNEAARAVAAELVLTNGLATEISDRIAAITQEVADRDSAISVAVAAEASIARTAEGANSQAISGEITRALGVEGGLQTSLTAEISRASGIEAGLQSALDSIISNVDQAALDSLTEIVAEFQLQDNNLNNAITTLAATATTDRALVRTEVRTAFQSMDVKSFNFDSGSLAAAAGGGYEFFSPVMPQPIRGETWKSLNGLLQEADTMVISYDAVNEKVRCFIPAAAYGGHDAADPDKFRVSYLHCLENV